MLGVWHQPLGSISTLRLVVANSYVWLITPRNMGLSENSVPHCTQWLMIIIPTKWL